jgi:urocanate hydratase
MSNQEENTRFRELILKGIPEILPNKKPYPVGVNSAPIRKNILSKEEKQLAIRNALRYFPEEWHQILASEFAEELKKYGRIYMHRFKPEYELYARDLEDYPAKSIQAASIMLMIQNNLDPAVAQHPEELITY